MKRSLAMTPLISVITWVGQRQVSLPSAEPRPSLPWRRLRPAPRTATSGSSGNVAGRRPVDDARLGGRQGDRQALPLVLVGGRRSWRPRGCASRRRRLIRLADGCSGGVAVGSAASGRGEPRSPGSARGCLIGEIDRADLPPHVGQRRRRGRLAACASRAGGSGGSGRCRPRPAGSEVNALECSNSSISATPSGVPIRLIRWAVNASSSRSVSRRRSSGVPGRLARAASTSPSCSPSASRTPVVGRRSTTGVDDTGTP